MEASMCRESYDDWREPFDCTEWAGYVVGTVALIKTMNLLEKESMIV
jgi:hypothetical protein